MNFTFFDTFMDDYRAIAAQIASTELGACAAGLAICAAALYIFFYITSERELL